MLGVYQGCQRFACCCEATPLGCFATARTHRKEKICDNISKKDFICAKQTGQLPSFLPDWTTNACMALALPRRGVLAVVGVRFAQKRGLLLFNNFRFFFTLTSTSFVFSFSRLELQKLYLEKSEREAATLLNTTKSAACLATGFTALVNLLDVCKLIAALLPSSDTLTLPPNNSLGDVKMLEDVSQGDTEVDTQGDIKRKQ